MRQSSGDLLTKDPSEGTTALLSGVEVSGTQPIADGTGGWGITAQDGAFLHAVDCRTMGNIGRGVSAKAPGTTIRLSNVEVRDTLPPADGTGAVGISVLDGAAVLAEDCQVEGNSNVGIFAGAPYTQLVLSNVEVRDTLPTADGINGVGITVEEGASLLADDCTIENNSHAGMFVMYEGTTAHLSNTVIRDTQPKEDGTSGRGIEIGDGAHLHAENSQVEGNSDVGVFASGEGTEVVLSNVEVRDTQPDTQGIGGRGIEVQRGATLQAVDCTVEDNGSIGIFSMSEGTVVDLDNVEVLRTHRPADRMTAVGMGAEMGALLSATGTTIRQTEGLGLFIAEATMSCTGCELSDNAFAGAFVWGVGSLELAETIIHDTIPDSSEGGGVGIYIDGRFGPNTLNIDNTTIENQPYAAVWLDGDGAFAIRNSTLVGGYGMELTYPDGTTTVQQGDAIVATRGVSAWDGTDGLLLEGNEIRDATRAGVLLDGSAAVLSSNSFIGNPTDVIWQDCDGVGEPSGLDDVPVVDHCPLFNHHVAPLEYNLWFEDAEPL